MHRQMTTLDFLDRGVDVYGDAVGVIAHDGTEYTYDAFGDRVDRAAAALSVLGIDPGDRVALLAPNTHWFLETLFAINVLGAISVPLNYRLISEDYEYILNDCGAQAIVADHEYAAKVEAIRDNVPVTAFVANPADRVEGDWQDYESLITDADPSEIERPDISEDDPATINYTSGTTGEPKGVVRTHRTEHLHALITAHHTEISDDDAYLWTLPMFHVNGWGYPYVITGVGGTHVCQRHFDAGDAFDRIRAHDVTYLCGAPTVLDRMIDHYQTHDIAATGDKPVRIATAASPPPESTIRTVEDKLGWNILHVYGLTETGPLITTSNSPRRIESEGRFAIKTRQGHAMLGTELRVVDEDGEDIPPNDRAMGEIIVRGNQVMDRYWNKPERTREAFSGRVDGWFHTGDIASIDERGMISIKDRKKDVIISGGENISSVEVEDALYAHPDIERVGVIGVPHEEWGETPKAIVVAADGADLTEDGVIEFARDNLAKFKCPTIVEFVDDLPETATGKIRKVKLREAHGDVEG
ncbi:long-chain-fatty-acid--CoA ligase [Halalkalirubrum salinum]|uniref:long-chain-fatty-acid--CoA ligase n=1 Tax=Halalkalirubrum salinum TaxID=2563889 RepID=UPI0010FB374A|nr:long-chain-fatty-acid--CoA ligase [Halalkalirubrum salinum]